jgi:hypothetical protein
MAVSQYSKGKPLYAFNPFFPIHTERNNLLLVATKNHILIYHLFSFISCSQNERKKRKRGVQDNLAKTAEKLLAAQLRQAAVIEAQKLVYDGCFFSFFSH